MIIIRLYEGPSWKRFCPHPDCLLTVFDLPGFVLHQVKAGKKEVTTRSAITMTLPVCSQL